MASLVKKTFPIIVQSHADESIWVGDRIEHRAGSVMGRIAIDVALSDTIADVLLKLKEVTERQCSSKHSDGKMDPAQDFSMFLKAYFSMVKGDLIPQSSMRRRNWDSLDVINNLNLRVIKQGEWLRLDKTIADSGLTEQSHENARTLELIVPALKHKSIDPTTFKAPRWLSKVAQRMEQNPSPYYTARLAGEGDNLLLWDVTMFGPPETPYVGGKFKVTIDLSDVILYEKIPKVRVVTPIFHPDISQHKTANETNNQHDFGEICVQFFCHDDMRSRRDVPHILDRLRQLLFDPIGEYPPNYPAYSLLCDDWDAYVAHAHAHAVEHAGAPPDLDFTTVKWPSKHSDDAYKE